MSIREEFRFHEARVLDRLADGELPADDRRELLLAFEDEPALWRRCALTLLEHQAWREDLRKTDRAASADPPATVAPQAPAASLKRASSLSNLALAAALLMAFSLGWRFGRTPAEAQSIVPANNHVAESSGGQDQFSPAREVVADDADVDDAVRWETFTLAMRDATSGQERQIELPAITAEGLESALLSSMDSAVPPGLIKELESAGHEVRRQNVLMPVALQDGRQLMVPVEELNVRMAAQGSKQPAEVLIP